MRIIGYLDRPGLIVTVFKNDNKISVKFEQSMLEQVFKIRDDLYLSDLKEIDSLFDSEWMSEIEVTFEQMARAREHALKRYRTDLNHSREEEII